MCKCRPEVRTPYCGKEGCQWPDHEKRAHASEMAQRIKDQAARDEADNQRGGLLKDLNGLLEKDVPATVRLRELQAKAALTEGERIEVDFLLRWQWTHNRKAS